MRGKLKFWMFFILISVSYHSRSNDSEEGFISGKILLDETWEKTVYLSFIGSIETKYAVSNEMILANSSIDSTGNFSISLKELPKKWAFLRLHVVKKDETPASLIIGGKDENHYFIIANRSSKIVLENSLGNPIFDDVTISGAEYMRTFNYINKLVEYPNTISFENSGIEKEFINLVVTEKLKAIADTCSNPLVSLYAIKQFDFKADFVANPAFYKAYLTKTDNQKSNYFKAFRSQFSIEKTSKWYYIIPISIIGSIVLSILFLKGKKSRMLKTLSNQERKVFELLRAGASNQEIASNCHIEVSTVKSHVSNIFSKLKVKSRKELINLNSK